MLRRLPRRVGDDAEDDAERHAGELHQRQQEAGLHQRQAERVAQHRDRRRQLADVQRGDDAGEDHEQRRIDAARGRCCHGLRVSPSEVAGASVSFRYGPLATSIGTQRAHIVEPSDVLHGIQQAVDFRHGQKRSGT